MLRQYFLEKKITVKMLTGNILNTSALILQHYQLFK